MLLCGFNFLRARLLLILLRLAFSLDCCLGGCGFGDFVVLDLFAGVVGSDLIAFVVVPLLGLGGLVVWGLVVDGL